MRFYVFCDKPSSGANVLRNKIRALGHKCNRLYGIKNPKKPGVIINWGSSRCPTLNDFPVVNSAFKVPIAFSKVQTFKLLEERDVPHVKYTADKVKADEWVKKGFRVFIREDGLSSGRGIQLYNGTQELHGRQFYSRVFPKTHEFRAHVVGGQVVDLTQKKRAAQVQAPRDSIDNLIRVHDKGWIFAHDNLVITDPGDLSRLTDLAISAVDALELDFGAVDILATFDKKAPRRLGRCVICEVNTRPGLENQVTVEAYAKKFVEDGVRHNG